MAIAHCSTLDTLSQEQKMMSAGSLHQAQENRKIAVQHPGLKSLKTVLAQTC